MRRWGFGLSIFSWDYNFGFELAYIHCFSLVISHCGSPIEWEFFFVFSLQLQFGVDESYTLLVPKAKESSQVTIEVRCIADLWFLDFGFSFFLNYHSLCILSLLQGPVCDRVNRSFFVLSILCVYASFLHWLFSQMLANSSIEPYGYLHNCIKFKCLVGFEGLFI